MHAVCCVLCGSKGEYANPLIKLTSFVPFESWNLYICKIHYKKPRFIHCECEKMCLVINFSFVWMLLILYMMIHFASLSNDKVGYTSESYFRIEKPPNRNLLHTKDRSEVFFSAKMWFRNCTWAFFLGSKHRKHGRNLTVCSLSIIYICLHFLSLCFFMQLFFRELYIYIYSHNKIS